MSIIIDPYRRRITAPQPAFSNVVALLHFDGTDGSTAFTDVIGNTWTANGNAQLTTADFKNGTASLALDGTGDYASTPSNVKFQVGTSTDFCVEAWCKFTSSKLNTLVNKRDSAGAEEFSLYITSGTGGRIQLSVFGSGSAIGTTTYNVDIPLNIWCHIAASRQGTTMRSFLNGQLGDTSTQGAGTVTTNVEPLKIGRDGFSTARDFQGRIDEFRMIKGEALYTTSFIPPPGPHPDS